MELLWPDLAPKAAANNLRYTLHQVRWILESASATASCSLHLHGSLLSLCPEGRLWVDVEAFEDAALEARRVLDPAAYRAAVSLYPGDLLPADRYEAWAESRRTELRETYLAVLIELARLHEDREEFGSAIEALRQVVVAEPTHDRAHVGLMRLYALSGRQSAALGQYEQLRETLSRELGVEPGAAACQLHQRILPGRFPPASLPPTGSLPKEPLGTDRHNLPTARTSFVGREHELAGIKRALSTTRLLTLSGACGSGKTRLALRAANDLAFVYPDGAWLVELATLSDGWLVQQAVAAALRVREQPNRPLLSTLVDALRDKRMLVVLDNCEHLIDATAYLVEDLLRSCPHLRVLATSREALGVVGEVKRMVPPLSLPNLRHPLTVEELARSEAVRLFLERARCHHPAFALTTQNKEAVADVCRRLEGLQLAIELAAARIGTLSVKEIAARLRDPLRLLTTGSRTAPPRQRTLRRTLDWSYALLAEPERRLFEYLSVFADGWTLKAADTVGVGDGIRKEDVLDLLSRQLLPL
jgi:predicted ATPase/DNA-binding SARP family transcriptional activator